MISNSIMKTHEFEDEVFYRTACDCGSDEHDITLDLEFDSDFNDLILHLYQNVMWSSEWNDKYWYQRIWKRIKAACKILFTGYLEMEASFLLRSEDHINDFIKALQEGKKKIKTVKENK